MEEAIVLLSGGIDSATCVYLARRRYGTRAITFVYHGILEGELRAAGAVARRAEVVEHRFVRLPDLKEAADLRVSFGGLPPTYIPMRNAVFYSLAASYAEEVGAEYIVGGHNKDDLGVFRDTTLSFFENLQCAFRTGSRILEEKRTTILRPLRSKTKAQVVRLASSLGVPLELTWSCHSDRKDHCWKCDGCLKRTRSFERAGIPDPLRGVSRAGKIS